MSSFLLHLGQRYLSLRAHKAIDGDTLYPRRHMMVVHRKTQGLTTAHNCKLCATPTRSWPSQGPRVAVCTCSSVLPSCLLFECKPHRSSRPSAIGWHMGGRRRMTFRKHSPGSMQTRRRWQSAPPSSVESSVYETILSEQKSVARHV
ncbi:hypothetical protein FIBSPDRAFT_22385 [Athelia psychrophila]|uniref:Uncharacterized protein n=1 Tax=Athelia psychrophila TaxID=1759441 RepID=A0A167TVJ5_9AGAM|nr:hypothetical protein FIBSPDRAFT_489741 [Fibularhizoctonia sp. CBS 109695]KZP17628.1 hypothetical protein FIBSPDRAFT_22385 [Fibularhizoctonia sp. CBS 109695]